MAAYIRLWNSLKIPIWKERCRKMHSADSSYMNGWTGTMEAEDSADKRYYLPVALYASVVAIEGPNRLDEKQWLAYWIIYSFFTLVEIVLQPLLEWWNSGSECMRQIELERQSDSFCMKTESQIFDFAYARRNVKEKAKRASLTEIYPTSLPGRPQKENKERYTKTF
ncbi:hypothetical protein JHK85_013885 [Glycine max]|nr:hypothetical protein JHK85_013885 [Glycine max]